ncbi:MAG: SDR family NAD(P)-dependent oxidoreductase [Tatlockia sp.]|nr:SDR family NAD(P)-dependent oxidoreductase [Tatlockia sp.]
MESSPKVAVITGAASGIGLALAEVCIKSNLHVVMADCAEKALHNNVERLAYLYSTEVLAVVCDVTKPEDLNNLARKTFEHFSRIDWLFNNAGISGQLAPIWELGSEPIRKVMDVNLHGAIHGLQAFLPLMFKQAHRSHIINIASFYSLCSGSQMAAYAMSKHALLALSESLYFDLQRLDKPVDVSIVCPSFANTGLLANSQTNESDKLHQMMMELIARSAPAIDVAEHIIKEVKKKTFYILPDKEVKDYCEQRSNAIINQAQPHQHSIEKIIVSLSRRALAKEKTD